MSAERRQRANKHKLVWGHDQSWIDLDEYPESRPLAGQCPALPIVAVVGCTAAIHLGDRIVIVGIQGLDVDGDDWCHRRAKKRAP